MSVLVRAELRARWRSLVGIGLGCLAFLLASEGTYEGLGGQQGVGRTFQGNGLSKVWSAFSGSPSVDISDPTSYLGFCFAYPVFLALVISVAISSAVAAIAADVESGRAEMLYTAPVSRTAILGARLAGWLIAQTAVLAWAVAAALLGAQLSADLSDVSPLVPLRVAVQLLAVLYFLGAAAFAASARSRTRGTALAAAIAITAGSYVANLVALLWSPAGFLRHLSPFGYFDASAAAHHVDWSALGVLVGSGTLLLLLTRRWLENRDLT